MIIPLTKPIKIPAIIPTASAITGFNPTLSLTIAIRKGARANVEPTERSNSPEMISMVIPTATMPSSGIVLIIMNRFSFDKKALLTNANIVNSTTVIITILISLYLSIFISFLLLI